MTNFNRTVTSIALACPHCGSDRLRSDEVATIGYPVAMFRDESGNVDVEYTGEEYDTFDEGTVYSGDIWCRDCGDQLTESDLVSAQEVDA